MSGRARTGGKEMPEQSPPSARARSNAKTYSRPFQSARRPRSGAHIPPTLTANPRVTPEAIPDPPRQVFLTEHDEHARRHEDENSQRNQECQGPILVRRLHKHGQEYHCAGETACESPPAGRRGRPASPPAVFRRCSFPERLPVLCFPAAAVRCQRVDEVKRQKGVQSVENDRPADRRPAQDAERAPIVASVQCRLALAMECGDGRRRPIAQPNKAAMIAGGGQERQQPRLPQETTTAVVSAGARANPSPPPTENRLMPVVRRSPLAR